MMGSSLMHISPHLLGVFMLALACVPLIFVWQDSQHRDGEKKRLVKLRQEARIAAELRTRGLQAAPGFAEGWAGEARR